MVSRFTQRFNIDIGQEEAQKRFMNRVRNLLFGDIRKTLEHADYQLLCQEVALEFGEPYNFGLRLDDYVHDDFAKHLQAVEVIYNAAPFQRRIEKAINHILALSEVDLGIRWRKHKGKGMFAPSGAKLLDDKLVNDVLTWLLDPKFETVVRPFRKGLAGYMRSRKHPDLLEDVVKDMYEALEAMAKIVTGRPGRDLSANRELFFSKVKASEPYKQLLADYIDYANKFRHSPQHGSRKPQLSDREVESFIYLTGLFLRLALPGS